MKLQHFYSLLAQQATRSEHRSGGPIFCKESGEVEIIYIIDNWLVVSNIFFHPYLGE